jgi:signal-induced proliferation-associated 1 like protein 1
MHFLTVADSTGTHSLYTTYKDYEIMFHVSTMLPYTPNNKQQVRDSHVIRVFPLNSFPQKPK